LAKYIWALGMGISEANLAVAPRYNVEWSSVVEEDASSEVYPVLWMREVLKSILCVDRKCSECYTVKEANVEADQVRWRGEVLMCEKI
jgi:hypothetical protein